MDIQLIGAWGELIGGISGLVAALGVIATLLYLARQIQQNTKSVQSANYATWIESMSGVHSIHMQITDFVEEAMHDSRELTEEEYWSFHNLSLQVIYAFEAVFLFWQNGTVDKEYFESRMRMMKNGVIDRPGFSKWWDGNAADVCDSRFVEYVEKNLKGQSTHILPSFGSKG